jgi:hypothetical protein
MNMRGDHAFRTGEKVEGSGSEKFENIAPYI